MPKHPALTALSALLLLAPALGLAQSAQPTAAPARVAAVDHDAMKAIRAEDLKRDLTYLASDELEGRATPSPGQVKAADYLAKAFAELKLKPGGPEGSYFQPVKLGGRAALRDDGKLRVANVVAMLEGTDPNAGAIVFSAHFDHLGKARKPNKDGDQIYNGADDDGSGTVAVLALARAYAARKERPARSVIFACFTAEEVEGYGSRAYVAAPPIPMEKTICDLNLEMLGRTHQVGAKRTWMTGWDYSTLGEIVARGAKEAGVEVYPDPFPAQDYYTRSDNMSFVMMDVIGHSFSAGSTHPDYHGVDDEVDRIEFDNLEALVRGIYLGSSLIATGAETPKPKKESLAPDLPRRRPPTSKPAGAPAKG
ncbi:MAG: M20/M25/M40 family metallo-hydrolase [Planctomycetes bacterium]|nr:M20/M25/M40 family metallo-hydrolase [Planctomycetota bacterium]